MNFNAPLLRPIRILLFPFSLVYALVVWIRNRLFDKGLLPSTSFNFPIICVGNLAVGGTGKSTMVEYLVRHLQQDWKLGVLSRGYKRKTRGYALAGEKSTALEIGDEPMQIHQKFPDISVAVGEERLVAIPQLLHDKPELNLIILDDAFQHRSVNAGLNILLTEYSNLYTRDWYLPTGDLRDQPGAASRSQIVVVTKCPPGLSVQEAAQIREELRLKEGQQLFFSTIRYGTPYHLAGKETRAIHAGMEVLLVSGIANPLPLKQYLLEKASTYYEMLYSDHHIFSIDDWNEIVRRFDGISNTDKIILTTEKDAVRLEKFAEQVKQYPLFVIPIEMQLLFEQDDHFLQSIRTFITSYPKTENIS